MTKKSKNRCDLYTINIERKHFVNGTSIWTYALYKNGKIPVLCYTHGSRRDSAWVAYDRVSEHIYYDKK